MPTSTKTYNVKRQVTKPYEVPEYQGVQYDDAAYKSRVDTSYYTGATERYREQAERDRASQLGQASDTLNSNLKQAYITKMQNQRALNDNLVRSGIRGGTTETANMGIMNQYGQARAAANTDYSNSVNSINQSIDRNIFDYTSDMDARAEEYRQNMAQTLWNADREDYSNKYNAQREDIINQWQAQREADAAYIQAINDRNINRFNAAREDRQQAIENKRTSNQDMYERYVDTFAGLSDKALKNKYKSIKKKLGKKGLSSAQRRRLNAQLRAIGRIRGDRRG